MSALRLILWPAAFALSAYRAWARREEERERAMLQAVAETLAGGARVVRPVVHGPYECALPGYHASRLAEEVTCPECRASLASALLIAPEDFARRDGAS